MRIDILLLSVFLFVACKKDVNEGLLYRDEIAQSEQVYAAFRERTGNSYRYMVRTESWTGYVTETEIIVEKGTPVGRHYKLLVRDSSALDIRDEWIEDQSTLGSHNQGFPTWTLDRIYDTAKYDWLRKRRNTDTYFETKNEGMISTCGYVEKGCADDCFTGVEIWYIEALN